MSDRPVLTPDEQEAFRLANPTYRRISHHLQNRLMGLIQRECPPGQEIRTADLLVAYERVYGRKDRRDLRRAVLFMRKVGTLLTRRTTSNQVWLRPAVHPALSDRRWTDTVIRQWVEASAITGEWADLKRAFLLANHTPPEFDPPKILA